MENSISLLVLFSALWPVIYLAKEMTKKAALKTTDTPRTETFEGWVEDRRAFLAKNSELWQFDLMDSRKIYSFCKERGVSHFNEEHIRQLWQAGIVRADVVSSNEALTLSGLELLIQHKDTYIYLDKRKLEKRENGYGGSLPKANKKIHLLFHPFRFYLLYHVKRVFSQQVAATQFLLNPDGYLNVAKHHNEFLSNWTATDKFPTLFNDWNLLAETAIVLEPCSYHRIFSTIRWRGLDTQESIVEKLNNYEDRTLSYISTDNLQTFEEMRKKLCSSAEEIDGNKTLHMLLRLMSREKRERLKGDIGGSVHLTCMAETLRRACEKATKQELPEEDELGFGQWMDGARKILYGTKRVLDAKKDEIRDFLSDFNLDFGTKVRCYVEGDTEIGALKHAIGEVSGIEFINLRGQVAANQGKGLSFKDSLRNDLKAKVFSIVFIDGDREDYVRALRKAAEEDIFTGAFYVAKPDFEFSYFTLDELINVILQTAEDLKLESPTKEILAQAVSGVTSSKDFFRKVKQKYPQLSAFDKGEDWGKALMKYALEHKKDCPLVEAVFMAARATTIKFDYSRSKFKIDSMSGKIINR